MTSRVRELSKGEMQLGNHALGQLAHAAGHLDIRLAQEVSRPRAVESGVYTANEVERLADTQPAGEHGNIRDEADVLHELIALGARVASEHAQVAVEMRQAENGLE